MWIRERTFYFAKKWVHFQQNRKLSWTMNSAILGTKIKLSDFILKVQWMNRTLTTFRSSFWFLCNIRYDQKQEITKMGSSFVLLKWLTISSSYFWHFMQHQCHFVNNIIGILLDGRHWVVALSRSESLFLSLRQTVTS